LRIIMMIVADQKADALRCQLSALRGGGSVKHAVVYLVTIHLTLDR
jgi:hypothetical protein